MMACGEREPRPQVPLAGYFNPGNASTISNSPEGFRAVAVRGWTAPLADAGDHRQDFDIYIERFLAFFRAARIFSLRFTLGFS
jgi:hypothetical protein